MSLRTKITATLILAALVPTLTVGISAIKRSREAVREQVLSGHLALIRALGASLDQELQSARRALDLAAQTWADNRSAEYIDDDASRREAGRLLSRIRRHVPILSRISIVDVHGQHVLGDPVPKNADLGAHGFGGYIGDLVIDGGGVRVRAASQARSRTGELVGTFIAELDLEFISKALASARLGPGARLYVVDGDGRLVAQSDDSLLPTIDSLRRSHPAVERALGSAAEGVVEQSGIVAAYQNLSSFQSLRGVRWAIVHEQPESEAYALANQTAIETALVGLVALLCVIAAGVYMAARIEERDELRTALARGDRLAAVGTMAAGVAHEVGNPLTTILGYAKLLLEDRKEEDPDRRALTFIAEEAERLKGLTESMLDYARAEVPGQGPPLADVNPLVQRTVDLLEPMLRKENIRFALSLETGLPLVKAPAHGLQQILVNLVNNAAQAMKTGGVVTIDSKSSGKGVELTVLDQGPGVSEEARRHIFEPFYTTRAHENGTGLGLAVCRHLVNRFGGSIDVGPAPGGGAAFRVVLPRGEA